MTSGDSMNFRIVKVMLPAGRKRGVEISLPSLETPGQCMKAFALVIEAAANGDVTLDEVLAELDRREGVSGITEKATRR